MSRTLTSKVSTAIAETATSPTYLIKLGFNTALYLSTGATITYAGQSWVSSAVSNVSISTGSGGNISGTVDLLNNDGTYGALILSEGVRNKTIEVYKLYGAAAYVEADAVKLASGYMDEVTRIDDNVSITFITDGAAAKYAPRIALAAFVGYDMPTAGTRLMWNDQILILEAR